MNALCLRKRKIRECLLARNDEEGSLLGDCPGLLSVAVIKHQPKSSGMGKGFISVYNTQGTILEGRAGQELGTEAEDMERCTYWLARLPFTRSPGLQQQPTSISCQENASQALTGQSDGNNSSTEFLSSQVSRVCDSGQNLASTDAG